MSYKDLKVYAKAYSASLEMHLISLSFPKNEQYALADQLRRSSKSIALNIAEGYGRNSSTADFKRFLLIALGSCNEVQVIIEYCKDLEYISEEEYGKYISVYTEIGKMLNALHKNWQDIRR